MFPLKVFFKIGSPGSDGSPGLKQSLTKKIPHSFFDAFNQLQEWKKKTKHAGPASPYLPPLRVRGLRDPRIFDPNTIAWNGALLGERN